MYGAVKAAAEEESGAGTRLLQASDMFSRMGSPQVERLDRRGILESG